MTDDSPLVLVCLRNAAGELDGCLASLDRDLSPRDEIGLVGDASIDPQILALVARWREGTRLRVGEYFHDAEAGPVAACNAALQTLGERDAVLLHPAMRGTHGWLPRLRRAAADPRLATLSPWSNDAEFLSYPRFCEANPPPERPDEIAEAAAAWPEAADVELPGAAGVAMFLRGRAVRQLGGLDAESFSSLTGALGDFSRRAAAMGWRNGFCPGVFAVNATGAATGASGEDLQRLMVRWPEFQEQVARFVMDDPMRVWRDRLSARIAELGQQGPQRDLFGPSP
ncbi:glycosyltransferase family 2 protein [Arenimonas sp.]|uniref:glycosyltransferase family 2 protein n=1 Tax=Arenimonas sp. TaxID=1872635 RepID=UPI0039E61D37